MSVTAPGTQQAMRRIGLIGGITWPATSDYYRHINLDVRRRLGGDHSAEMVIRSLDLHPLLASVNDVPAVEKEVLAAARSLQAAGADLLGVASFTGHRYVAPLRTLALPFVDLIDAVGERTRALGLGRIAVWATSFALADEALMRRLAVATGAVLSAPPREIWAQLDGIVFAELGTQSLTAGSVEFLRSLLQQQMQDGAQALLLATTDFSPLAAVLDSSVPVFDAAEIHCDALVRAALR